MSDDLAWDAESWDTLGYYVRRVGGKLILVENVRTHQVDSGLAEIHSIYIDIDQLDAEWISAIHEQGEHLIEGKSCEFIPPDQEDPDLLFEDDEDLEEED